MGEGNKVPLVPVDMTNRENREALLDLARSMTTYVNRGIETRVNVLECTMTYKLRDFVRMNPSNLFGSKVGKYLQ